MLRRILVSGNSMAPTLRSGERRWAESWSLRFRPPRRGDVVVVRRAGLPFRTVKRVCAVPGDDVGDRSLGPGEYFVLGDNLWASTDSRSYGPLTRGEIEARVVGVSRRSMGSARE